MMRAFLAILAVVSGTVLLNAPARAVIDIDEELRCLALNIYFEARGEPVGGKYAVGHVVMNRVSSSRYPGTVCNVVRQGLNNKRFKCQFTWWCDGASDRPDDRGAWVRSMDLAYDIYVGRSKDPTGGALWYHADYVQPRWGKYLKANAKIGQHIFYIQHDGAKAAWARPDPISGPKQKVSVSQLREALTLDPLD